MKLPRLKLKINIKPILNYIILIVVTSLFVASILIALPLTEKYITKANYDLNTKTDTYWSKEYVISMTDTTDENILENTRNIFYKRLSNFGVEEVSTYIENGKIRIVLTTSKAQDMVEELISNRFAMQLVTRKGDVNFDDENNPYAYLLSTNYDATDWDRSDFRNIYVTQLKNSSGTYSYFAIFKLWPLKEKSFADFLAQYNGQYIGVNIDGFVTPHLVDTTAKVFAIPLSTTDSDQVKVVSLLYNSGQIPTTYTIESSTDLTPNIPSVDYLKVSIGIFATVIILYLYLLISKQSEKKILIKSLLSTILTFAIYLSILKIFKVSVDTFLLPIEAVLAIILVKVLAENKDSMFHIEVILLLTLTSMIFLGDGFVRIFAQDMLILSALSKFCLILSEWYINKVRNI